MTTKKYDVVLFDIDNTLTKLQPTLDVMGESFGLKPVTVEDIHSFTLAEAYGVGRATELAFWRDYEAYLSKNAVLAEERVNEMLARYTHEGTEVHVVTMRPPEVCGVTRKWLERNAIRFDRLKCLGQECKLAYAKKYGVEAIFEDNPRVFEDALNSSWKDQFDLFVVDYPFNQHVQNATRLHRESGLML